MNLQNRYLTQYRDEFKIRLNADYVQAVVDGRYRADPSNDYSKWAENMKGRPFMAVLESMADLVADHMRETYGTPPFLAAVEYNEDVATVFDDYEKAIRALMRFDMPVVYHGYIGKQKDKSRSYCIGVSNGSPLWFLYRDKIRSRKLALACQYAWPGALDRGMLDCFIITEGGKWRDLNDIVNGALLGIVLDDTKKNRVAVAISGLRSEIVKSARDGSSYIIATAVPRHHDYDMILDRAINIVGGLYIPDESNEDEDEE